MFLSRDQILSAPDISRITKTVEVAEWGGSVKIRRMNGFQREQFEEAVNAKVSSYNLRSRMAVISIVDDNGKQLFNQADVAALAEKSAKALDTVYQAALEFNGLTKKAVKDLEKNSESATSDATPSDSRDDSGSPTSTA